MSETADLRDSLERRYDRFQLEAIGALTKDFSEKPEGRFLLVVPTGGGKTNIAVRAVRQLFDFGVLSKDEDRVLWVAHRTELLDQAKGVFEKYASRSSGEAYADRVDFCMLSQVRARLVDDICLVVIDEAHHGAAKSYGPIFKKGVGVLGLTATPSRHDGKALDFEKESYSIGFPDLVELGVLLRPEVTTVEGGSYEITSIDDDDALDVLDNEKRNQSIVDVLVQGHERYRKTIVYVGTIKHAKSLYQLIKESKLGDHYESVGLITGEEQRRFDFGSRNELTEQRPDFIKAQKSAKRSLIVNVDVLTEGFDDPSVNTVVMARPTRSKLVYMQAIGRAIRLDPNNSDKTAHVVEITDDLPNIRYRIDNRWLFSDISDELEPAVEDRKYTTLEDLERRVADIFEAYAVPPELRTLPSVELTNRVTLLLFKVYRGEGQYYHLPVLVTNETRAEITNCFDFLSTRISTVRQYAPERVLDMLGERRSALGELGKPERGRFMLQALSNAWAVSSPNAPEEDRERFMGAQPWISFVAFRRNRSVLAPDLEAFITGMENQESIRASLLNFSYLAGYFLVRLPLPLNGTWGKIIPPDEFSTLQGIVSQLSRLKGSAQAEDQWTSVRSALDQSILPVEQKYRESLVTLVREGLDYFRELHK